MAQVIDIKTRRMLEPPSMDGGANPVELLRDSGRLFAFLVASKLAPNESVIYMALLLRWTRNFPELGIIATKVTVNALAAETKLSQKVVRNAVDGLEKKGLIVRVSIHEHAHQVGYFYVGCLVDAKKVEMTMKDLLRHGQPTAFRESDIARIHGAS